MEATLIYNPNARSIGNITADEIQETLREIGYYPVYKATNSEEDLNAILHAAKGLVVVAGGDGTLRAVALRVLNKNVCLTPLPLGMANNVSKTLGIQGDLLELIKGLKHPCKKRFDVGHVQGPWGEDYFLEGAGWGFFADALADYDPKKGKNVLRGVTSVVKTFSKYATYPSRMTLDGEDISGEYILVEVLNTVAIGPRLKLAPNANPCDGMFDVVRVTDQAFEGILDVGLGLLTENLQDLDGIEVTQGKKLELEWTGFSIHFDAEFQAGLREYIDNSKKLAAVNRTNGHTETVTIEIIPQALEFWLPQYPAQEKY